MEPWKQRFAPKLVSAEEAVARLKNGDRIYLGSICSEPRTIIRAIADSPLSDISMLQFLNGREAAALAKTASQKFTLKTFFRPRRTDQSEPQSDADYVPLFHSQIPDFFRRRRIPIDVAIVQVSPPDRFGRFSLGIAVDISLAAVESARMVIAQVNPLMPWTLGDTFIGGDRINSLVEAKEDLAEVPEEPLGTARKGNQPPLRRAYRGRFGASIRLCRVSSRPYGFSQRTPKVGNSYGDFQRSHRRPHRVRRNRQQHQETISRQIACHMLHRNTTCI